jgi:hypothetical protein
VYSEISSSEFLGTLGHDEAKIDVKFFKKFFKQNARVDGQHHANCCLNAML